MFSPVCFSETGNTVLGVFLLLRGGRENMREEATVRCVYNGEISAVQGPMVRSFLHKVANSMTYEQTPMVHIFLSGNVRNGVDICAHHRTLG